MVIDAAGRSHREPGTGSGGRFDRIARSGSGVALDGESLRCPACGQFTVRGGRPAHSCPHPDLVEITPALTRVLDVLRAEGARPYLVGGCVRDALVGVESKDVDIEVYGRSLDDLDDALRRAGISANAVGESFGVLTVRVDDEDFDIALPRLDSKVGDGHRGFEVEVDHTLDEVDASARRDFTINSMMWDPDTGLLIDAHGGLVDLENRVLRHTSDAFGDDPLRALRGVQFAGRFDMFIDESTADICRDLRDSFDELPHERVREEWAKVTKKARFPGQSLRALRTMSWDRKFPQLGGLENHDYDDLMTAVDIAGGIADDERLSLDDRELLMLAVLESSSGPGFIESVQPSKTVGARARALVGRDSLIDDELPTPAAVRHLARELGKSATIAAWTRVQAARCGRDEHRRAKVDQWMQAARETGVEKGPIPPLVTGEDLIAGGMKPGPRFAEILKGATAAQDDGVVANRDEALALLRRLSAS